MELKGIDVSSWQHKPDWPKIKKSGIEFAILRCHQKTGIDSSFNYNYKNAKNNGIKVGAYKLSYAENATMAENEADGVLEVLKNKDIDLPVFFDLEDDGGQSGFSKDTIEKLAITFLEKISNAGYNVGIYCNLDWYNNKISDFLKNNYNFWIARPPKIDDGELDKSLKPSVKNLIAWQYSFAGKVPGISGDVDMDVFYEKEPVLVEDDELIESGTTAEDILAIMRSWIGLSKATGTHKVIIDTYNSYLPHPRGYAVSYTDDYCDTTISAAFVKAGAVSIIGGIECGVEEHVKKFIQEGIWIEDGSIVPKVGDIVCYNWDKASQPNDGWSDHIGIVERVNGDQSFTTIEGNMAGGIVDRRTIPVGYGYIRGFARPKYATVSSSGEKIVEIRPLDEIAKEVIAGKWGNGIDRSNRLLEAGYSPALVQARVNELMNVTANPTSVIKEEVTSKDISRTPKFVGKVVADKLNVRTWAGTIYPRISSFPSLSYGNLIDVCDTVKDANDADWYFVKIAGQFYGFVSSVYVEKV